MTKPKPVFQAIHDALVMEHDKKGDPEGTRLAPERALMRRFQASDTSVRRALALLVAEGRLEKRHGSGNYWLASSLGKSVTSGRHGLLLVGHGQFGRKAGMDRLFLDLERRHHRAGLGTLVTETPTISTEQVRTLLARHSCPLVLLNSRNQTAELSAAGLLAPISQIPELARRDDRVFPNLAWKFSGPDGVPRRYGLPFLHVPSGLGVNLDLAEEAGIRLPPYPETWDDFLASCERFTEWRARRGRQECFASYAYPHAFSSMNGRSYYFMASGGKPYGENAADREQALHRYFRFLDRLMSGPHLEPVGIQAPDPFVSGNYLFSLQAASWLPRDLSRFNPKLRMNVVPPPIPAAGHPRFTGVGTSLLSVCLPPGADPRHPGMVSLLSDLYQSEHYGPFARDLGAVPADPQVLQALLRRSPAHVAFSQALFTSLEPHAPMDEQVESLMDRVIRDRFQGRVRSLESQVPRLAESLARILPSPATHLEKQAPVG